MKLVEPLGLLYGAAARDAMERGLALPLAGGPAAFCLARLHGDGPPFIVPSAAIPASFAAGLDQVSAPHPPWAGLPADRPLVMGILNVTPDSFSDGGRHASTDDAVAAGRRMAGEGADLIDVGGESTRPGSDPVDPALEQARILPVIRELTGAGIVVSVDTRQAATMAAALEAGARIVNDVSGFVFDPDAAALVRARGCPVVVMHMRGTPKTMNALTDYADVAVDVTRELAARLETLGLARGQVAVDPGIGFAKTGRQSQELLARLPLLLNLGCRIVAGVSRKSFIGHILDGAAVTDRESGSLAAGLAALPAASVLRVHDVAATAQAVKTAHALRLAA